MPVLSILMVAILIVASPVDKPVGAIATCMITGNGGTLPRSLIFDHPLVAFKTAVR